MDNIRTYRVRSLHEALQLIREDLGPEAAVLHTREVSAGWFGWKKELEVTASAEIETPSRLPRLRVAEFDSSDTEDQHYEGLEVELPSSDVADPLPLEYESHQMQLDLRQSLLKQGYFA